uniref:Uncharacterized protein n=1 Tax=Glossina pallidipes TaxID=7398 RepID=A0A1A9Z300_GLOPL
MQCIVYSRMLTHKAFIQVLFDLISRRAPPVHDHQLRYLTATNDIPHQSVLIFVLNYSTNSCKNFHQLVNAIRHVHISSLYDYQLLGIAFKAIALNNKRFKVKKIYQPGEGILERLSPLASAAALGMCVSRALKKL